MGGRIVDLLSGPHLATEALLPWLINGTLSDAERRKVEAHLATCAQCRAELERQQELVEHYVRSEPVAANDPEAAFARLRERLVDSRPRRGVRHVLTPIAWWRLGFAVQLGVIAMLGVTLMLRGLSSPPADDAGGFRGMGDAGQRPVGDALVFFNPASNEEQLRVALQRAGARIVDGPTAAGAYIIRLDGGPTPATLGALRSDPAILRVESLTSTR